MTARGAPVVWLRDSRDTTYVSTAKNRCADCRVEVCRGVIRCRICCSRHSRKRRGCR